MNWTEDENRQLGDYFNGKINAISLFGKIKKINPSRTYESVMTRIRHMREEGWIKKKEFATGNMITGYLDIEATQLNGDFGYMLSWCIKTAGKNEIHTSVITKKEIFDYEFDKRLVIELLDVLKHYDIVYTHYGADGRFDFPFIRTRAYAHGLEESLPNYQEKYIMDTWPVARMKLKLHNNRLDSIAEAVGVKTKKTPLSAKTWCLASVGEPKSLKYIVTHNIKDVKILEAVHKKLKKVERPILRSI